jgi:hypothetical protein
VHTYSLSDISLSYLSLFTPGNQVVSLSSPAKKA